MRRTLLVSVVVAALSWQAAGVLAELPPIIPRDVLFGEPDQVSPRISPDGQRLAYLAPDHDVLNVWVRTIGKTDDRVVTAARERGIRKHVWAHDNRHLLYLQDRAGDENWHVWAVDLNTREARDLTPMMGIQARLLAVEPEHPNEILIALNDRDPKVHDVYRVNLQTAQRDLVARNDQNFITFFADHDLRVRSALKTDRMGRTIMMVRDDPQTAWRNIVTWELEDTLTSWPIAFTRDNSALIVLSSAGTNTAQLRQIDLGTGSEKVLASDDRVDIAGLLMHPVEHRVQAVNMLRERRIWNAIDRAVEADLAAIGKIQSGDFEIIGRDNADRTWLVAFEVDDGPVRYYTYDRSTKKVDLLFSSREALEQHKLAKMEPFEVKARDGMKLHGYLTKPVGIKAENLPMVVLAHEGPWQRDVWGFDPTVQLLANRGYAVLQVNFRGSYGYGKDFLNAGNREWGAKMQTDLLDAVNHVVGQGIADRNRVAIMGQSYGGYATLAGLAFHPDVFCCGVDLCGPSNLISYMKSIPQYWKTWEPILWDRVGHPDRDVAMLRERSPLFAVHKIDRPLLVAQGANDPRVRKVESMQMVDALRRAGKLVEYVEYANEGHDLVSPENRLDFIAKAETFLAKHAGGRCQ